MGAPDACEHLGSLLATGKEAIKGAALLGEACEHGSASACARLAALHEDGRGVTRDPAKAFAIARKACESGAAPACERVADLARKAGPAAPHPASWLEPLCARGQSSACTAMADLQAKGVGVPKDVAGASARYARACDAGETAACARGARLLLAAPGPKHAPAQSAAPTMLQKACDAGDGASCADLAQLYATGEHVPKDAARGAALLEAACLIPDARSCERAAEVYERGKGAQPTKAQAYYQRACYAGSPRACVLAARLPAASDALGLGGGAELAASGAGSTKSAPSRGSKSKERSK
jgi:TPR repeat protein